LQPGTSLLFKLNVADDDVDHCEAGAFVSGS
jgi:hypothetical protein